MCALHNHKIQWNARFMALCVLEEYARDNNDASYISAAYSTANVVLIMVWGHKLQCMFEEYAKDN